jgi:hypothetical protein
MNKARLAAWIRDFRNRIDSFENDFPPHNDEIPVSIKVRTDSGCYSRGCCTHAFRIIDKKVNELRSKDDRFCFVEHENGPEILTYLTLIPAGLTIPESIVELVTVIIKARTEGRRHGDRHSHPITLAVRCLKDKDVLSEARILTFRDYKLVSSDMIQEILLNGCKKLFLKGKSVKVKRSKAKSTRGKKG